MTAQATKTLTRDDVVRLGQAGRPWEFLGVAVRALEQAPGDLAIRFLAAANLARLGLRSLAGGELDALPREAQGHGDVAALRGALGGLPRDVVCVEQLRATCAGNVETLRGKVELGVNHAAWERGLKERAAWRAVDGNVVWGRAGAGLSGCDLADHVGNAARWVKSAGPLTKPALIVLDGMGPPWMFRGIYAATPGLALGFRMPLLVAQADVMELLDGLAAADLRRELADERVRVFVGLDAGERLGEYLRSRVEYQLSALVVPLATTRVKSPVQEAIGEALKAQEAEFVRLKARVEATYAGRDEAWWARRYRGAAAGDGALKVLVPTCRYSTFIKHSAADLCAALKRQGHEAELYVEPDDFSRLTGVGYLRAFERMQPDLVVLINFPRATMGESMPRNVPFVCWVQDSMPQLFDGAVGAAQGPLDFLIGHTFLELFQKYGYPMQRAMPISVVADEGKFYPRAAGSGPWGKSAGECPEFSCEMAFVSHHSETPRDMHGRLRRETAHSPAIVEVLDRLYGDVEGAVRCAGSEEITPRLGGAVAQRLREVFGEEPEQRTQTLLMRQYAGPMSDRMLRHETLSWAGELAVERGWRLKIFGRGWEKHATLGRFAQPELMHGEELRGAYQGALVHLHAAASTLTHQRVIECSLSGGLCLCRLHRELTSPVRLTMQLGLFEQGPDLVDEVKGWHGYVLADHPEAMALASRLGAVGHTFQDAVIWISRARAASYGRFKGVFAKDIDPLFLLGDLAETTFSNKEDLGRLVERAAESPGWRSAVSAMVAKRARAHLTHDALVRRMLALISGSLGAGALREAV